MFAAEGSEVQRRLELEVSESVLDKSSFFFEFYHMDKVFGNRSRTSITDGDSGGDGLVW